MPERGPARGLAAVDSAGAAGALAQYATLRQRYYGSAAYDFSRGVLTSVAEQLLGRGSAAEAVAIMELELETNGENVWTLMTLGNAQVRAGQRAAGLARLQRALAIASEGEKAFVQQQIDRAMKP